MKLSTEIPRIKRQLSEAHMMNDAENDQVKLLGMHYQLFYSNAELAKVYCDLGQHITAGNTRFDVTAEHNELALEILTELQVNIVFFGRPCNASSKRQLPK